MKAFNSRSSVYFLPLAMLLGITGCKSPFDSTKNASGGATGTIGNATTFVVFSSELQTGGGVFEYPGANGQSLVLNDTSNPISNRSIRYSWNGMPVPGYPTVAGASIFVGFDLMHVIDNTPTLSIYNSTPGRNLTASPGKQNYTKVTFYARATLSADTVLKVEAVGDGNPNDPDPCMTLSTSGSDNVCLTTANGASNTYAQSPQPITSSWQKYTLTIPTSLLAHVKDFFKATYVYGVPPNFAQTPFGSPDGQGGIVYFDQIQYEQ
jgi:hypothetical protein